MCGKRKRKREKNPRRKVGGAFIYVDRSGTSPDAALVCVYWLSEVASQPASQLRVHCITAHFSAHPPSHASPWGHRHEPQIHSAYDHIGSLTLAAQLGSSSRRVTVSLGRSYGLKSLSIHLPTPSRTATFPLIQSQHRHGLCHILLGPEGQGMRYSNASRDLTGSPSELYG